MPQPTASDRSVEAHRQRWGEPEFVARAPGRVNLIGEHTDYNDGFALPMALPFDTVLVMSSDGDRASGHVTVASTGFGEITLDPASDPTDSVPWARHIAGVVSLLREVGVPSGGWRAIVDTDIPTGASLSSSAALEVAAISGLLARAGLRWDAIDIARLGQRVENEVVGLPSGIMDQFISAGAIEGHASLMDCRELTLAPIRIPDQVVIAVMDTASRRVLADAAYGERRAACERAVAALGVSALRDASLDQVASLADETDRRRARHVVTENQRTVDAVDALGRCDVERFGMLMSESHISLRDDYEVSGPSLDAIVEIASAAPGCLGARMTGGGFAGCAVALVDVASVDAFERHVLDRYDHDGQTARIWVCAPAGGADVDER